MKSNASLLYNLFLVVGDFLALVAAFVSAYILRVTLDARPIAAQVNARTYLSVFLVLLPFWILIFALLGLYNSNIHEKRFSELGRLFIGSFVGLMFVVFWNFVSVNPIFPAKLVPIYGFVLAFIFLVIFRNSARYIRTTLFHYGIGITNILIIGNTKVAVKLIDSLYNSHESGYKIVGVVGSQHKIDHHPHLRIYKTFAAACQTIGTDRIHSIVQTELFSGTQKNNEILTFAQTNHISYRFIPGNTELFVGNIDVELFRASIPVIAVHQTPLLGWGRIVKRLFDIAVSVALLVITAPFTLLIVIFIKLSGGGSVVFRQTRLTRFNNEFYAYKFRTIKPEYNGLSPEEAFAQMGRPGLVKKYRKNGDYLRKDPRITPLGSFLRKTSLDELPQLFNVIKGDLSLVGPRALVPEELSAYTKRHAILSIKSGLTGLAQVSGRRSINYDERRQLDMYYVQNWSFWMDLVILAKTIRVVLSGFGAQ